MTVDDSQLRPCVIGGQDAKGLAVARDGNATAPAQKWAEGRARLVEVSTIPYGECLYSGPMLYEGEIAHVEMPVWVEAQPSFTKVSGDADNAWRRMEVDAVDLVFKSMGVPEGIEPVEHATTAAT